MLDPSIISNLGVSGFALWVLWMVSKLFIGMAEKKDIAHSQERKELDMKQRQEREEFLKRIDSRDDAFKRLQDDIRNNISVTLAENHNVLKQAIILVTRRAKNQNK